MQISNVYITAVEMPPRLRALSHERVGLLKASLAEVGLINPIGVYVRQDGVIMLATGAHRLQAARELDWESIPAVVTDGAEVDRLLMEIDENLCRSELSPAERAQHEARRKELWIAKHTLDRATDAAEPKVDAGSEELGGSNCPTQLSGPGEPEASEDDSSGHGQQDIDSRGQKKSPQQKEGFAASTAAITGENKRAINRNVRRGEELGGEMLRAITGTSLDKGLELDALMKLQSEERVDLVNRVKAGEEVSARQLLEAKTLGTEKINLAKRAVSALERCSTAMEPSEFAAAVRGRGFSGAIVPFAQVLVTGA